MIPHETNLKVCWPLKGFNNPFPSKIKRPSLRRTGPFFFRAGELPVVITISRVA